MLDNTVDVAETKSKRGSESGRFRSAGRRLMDLLRGPEPVHDRPGAMVLRQESKRPIPVQANGGLFAFQVYPMLTWSSDGLDPEMREVWIHHYGARVRDAIHRRSAPVARGLDARAATDLETKVNEELIGRTILRVDHDGAWLKCSAQVRVHLDERVQRKLQSQWERRYELEARHQVELVRADLAEGLSKRWLGILEALRTSPMAVGAATLTEREFAEVVREIATEDRDLLKNLIGLLEDTVRNGPGLAAYETARIIDMVGDMQQRGGSGVGPLAADSVERVLAADAMDEVG